MEHLGLLIMLLEVQEEEEMEELRILRQVLLQVQLTPEVVEEELGQDLKLVVLEL